MKFAHKLHEPHPLPWKTWYSSHETSGDESFLQRLIAQELPRYRSLTRVRIGDGARTSFWHDKWMFCTSLAQAFPALFTHYTDTSGSVREFLATGFAQHRRARLTTAATEKLSILQSCLQFTYLAADEDLCFLDCSTPTPFGSRAAYRLMHQEDVPDPDAAKIWETKLPGKVFFGWLLIHARLNTRANLCHKNIRRQDEANCDFCQDTFETDDQ
jgi:hypothetical protein